MQNGLQDHDIKMFELKGWTGSYPLLKNSEANKLSNLYDSCHDKFVTAREISSFTTNEAFINKPWFKSLHAFSAAFYNLATHPAIVSKVCSILGENVILLGNFYSGKGSGSATQMACRC